jgi:hypothetical protein
MMQEDTPLVQITRITEARTSMTRPEVIMATSIEVSIAKDIFSPNETIEVWRAAKESIPLAGIRFEKRLCPQDSRSIGRRECFDFALQRLRIVWPELTIWLLACHSVWRPIGNRSTYLRLWKSLELAGITLPSGSRVDELSFESTDGVRFFGMLCVPENETARAYDVLDSEPMSFIACSVSEHAPDLSKLFDVWKYCRNDTKSLVEIANVVCKEGHMLFRPTGFFDDPEAGLDAILNPERLRQWIAIAR